MLDKSPICFTCQIEYQPADLTAMDPDTRKPLPPEPKDRSSDTWYDWNERARIIVCPKKHLVASVGRPRLAAVLVGDTEAGKDAMLNAVIHAFENKTMDARGLHAVVREDQRPAWEATRPIDFKGAATQPWTRKTPVQPVFLELVDRSTDSNLFDIIFFNHGGEDFLNHRSVQVSTKTIWERCPSLARADILVIFVPPHGLLDLPVDRGGSNDEERRFRTREATEAVSRTLREKRKYRADLTVVLALTKSDHYRGLEGFPDNVLSPRRHGRNDLEPLDITMANEQADLHAFMMRYGGAEIIKPAEKINGRYFIVALSGTGDDREGRAPAPGSAPDRSLDPILIRMMREKIGRLTAADIKKSRSKR